MRRRKKTRGRHEPDMIVSPLVTPQLPGSQPITGGYTNYGRMGSSARIQMATKLRTDLADRVRETDYAGSGEYSGGNPLTVVPLLNVVRSQHNDALSQSSPPPYTDHSIVMGPAQRAITS
ncbi:hypothetical protein ACEPAG_3494 [Sanghuangporus baumii]